jgi:hypothetical protein
MHGHPLTAEVYFALLTAPVRGFACVSSFLWGLRLWLGIKKYGMDCGVVERPVHTLQGGCSYAHNRVQRGLNLDLYLTRVFLQKLIARTASQEIPRLLRNHKVHYRTHKSPPFVRIRSQMNSIHTISPSVT